MLFLKYFIVFMIEIIRGAQDLLFMLNFWWINFFGKCHLGNLYLNFMFDASHETETFEDFKRKNYN